MNIKEVKVEGLARELQVSIPASELVAKLDARIEEVKGEVQIKGFRPGKVPASHVRKTFGDQLMGEVIQQAVNETSQSMLQDRKERPAFDWWCLIPRHSLQLVIQMPHLAVWHRRQKELVLPSCRHRSLHSQILAHHH